MDEEPDLNALLAEAGVEEAPVLTREQKVELLFSVSQHGYKEAGGRDAVDEYLAVEPALLMATDDKGWTPVLYAAFNGFADILEQFLVNHNDKKYIAWLEEKQADLAEDSALPEAAAMPVNSPLHWAAFKGHDEAVWVLLQHGFTVDDCDSCGNTAVHLAAAGGHTEIVKVLLTSGVNLTLSNFYGNTALDLASNEETKEVLKAASTQARCAATSIAFGPDQLFYRCSSCGRGFTEEASEGSLHLASLTSRTLKPKRLYSQCLFKIQEAEAVLEAIVDPASAARRQQPPSPMSPSPKAHPAKFVEEEKKEEEEGEEEKASESSPDDGASHLHRLQQALGIVESLGGDIKLIDQGKKMVRREKCLAALQEQIESLQQQRPLTRRGGTAALQAAINEAREAYCAVDDLNAAETVLQSALTEVRLLGSVTVCRNIKLATHSHDGDLKRLREAVEAAKRHNLTGDLSAEAVHLSTRLDAEVNMTDAIEATTAAVAEVERRMIKYADEDPTELPMIPLEEDQDPSEQKRQPTKIQRALDRLASGLDSLDELLANAVTAGADEALIESTQKQAAEAREKLAEQQVVEDERVVRMEAERAKRDKKKKKGKGKKGKKK